MAYKITFEDHGQDFLTWLITDDGRVLESEPFQYSVWRKATVLNTTFEVGGYVTIQFPHAQEPLTIKYPIANVEKT